MTTAKYILCSSLIFALVSSGLPFLSPQDANWDARVDLEDAIIQIKHFAKTADESGAFKPNVGKAISTLQMLAGLNTSIKSEGTGKSIVRPFSLDLPYLISAYIFSDCFFSYSWISEKDVYYQSAILIPSSPPPRPISIT